MAQLGELVAVLKAEYGDYVKGMDKAARETARAADQMDKRITSLSSSVKAGLAGIVGALSVGALTGAFKSVVDGFDVFDELAAKTHLSVEALSEYQYMAGLTSTSLDQITEGHKKLGKVMGEARDGNAALVATLQRHGVTLEQIQNLDSQSAFRAIADSFAELDNGVQKTNDSMLLMGKSIGPELIEFLNNGSAGFDRMAQEAATLGGVIDTETAIAAGKLNDNLMRLEVSAGAAGRALVADMLPGLVKITSQFVDARLAGFDLLKTLWTIGQEFNLSAEVTKREQKLKDGPGFWESMLPGTGDKDAYLANWKKTIEGEINYLRRQGKREVDDMLAEQNAGLLYTGRTGTPPAGSSGGGVTRPPKPGRASKPGKSALESALEADQKALERAIEALKSPTDKYIEQVGAITRWKDDGKLTQDQFNAMIDAEAQKVGAALGTWRNYEDALRDVAALQEEMRTPLERYFAELAKVDALLASGALDSETHTRKVAAMREEITKAFGVPVEAENEFKTSLDAMAYAVANWGDQVADVLLDTNASFSDMVGNMARQLAKIAISSSMQGVLGMLAGGVQGLFSGGMTGDPSRGLTIPGSGQSSMLAAQTLGLFGRAGGGNVIGGTPVVVGEHGRPEVFVPHTSGRVIPGAGAAINQTIHINGAPNPAELAGWAEQIKQNTLRAIAVNQTRGARMGA